ncbi:protein jagunal [Anaeramoeba flamelloides]|uniref:Protein jagunal n=1 Tax=Anaeramoeba flamelloides TaxID=1746091 RepID=A0ABQ8X1K0_9EUKA|nr:protein jagunal [Anaeramoeba flamelloides]
MSELFSRTLLFVIVLQTFALFLLTLAPLNYWDCDIDTTNKKNDYDCNTCEDSHKPFWYDWIFVAFSAIFFIFGTYAVYKKHLKMLRVYHLLSVIIVWITGLMCLLVGMTISGINTEIKNAQTTICEIKFKSMKKGTQLACGLYALNSVLYIIGAFVCYKARQELYKIAKQGLKIDYQKEKEDEEENLL